MTMYGKQKNTCLYSGIVPTELVQKVASAGVSWSWQWIVGFHKRQRITWPGKQVGYQHLIAFCPWS